MRISLVLLAYNQERFIADAVKSVLSQTYCPFEIILSDDCSTDATFDIMKETAKNYQGRAKLRLYRNKENEGLSAHFNLLMKVADGDIVVVCAGDDIAKKERVEITARCFTQGRNVSGISLQQEIIDWAGNVCPVPQVSLPSQANSIGFADYLQGKVSHPSGASRAYSPRIYEAFGPLSPRCPTEDTPMLLRAMLLGQFYSQPEIGILYRRHEDSASSPKSTLLMDKGEIQKQHRVDLTRAFQIGLIDKPTLRRYRRILSTYWVTRRIRSEFSRKGGWSQMAQLMLERNMSPSEKVRIAKYLLMRNFAMSS